MRKVRAGVGDEDHELPRFPRITRTSARPPVAARIPVSATLTEPSVVHVVDFEWKRMKR